MGRFRAGILALLLGCGAGASAGDATPGTCVTEHPPSAPFDVGDTESGASAPSPEPGGEPILVPPPTAAEVAQHCRDGGGSGCDERAFISRDAADCIARELGLAAGIQPWSTTIGYYENHQRVGWGIMTVREHTSDGFWGDALVLDATTGEELARTSYRAIGD
jgi:hypothetical protein